MVDVLLHSNKLFNVCLSGISSLLERFPNCWRTMRRRLPRFESYPLLDLYTHVESVLKSSTECNMDELRVGRIADIGFWNLDSPIVSAYSSSPSFAFVFVFAFGLMSFNAPIKT